MTAIRLNHAYPRLSTDDNPVPAVRWLDKSEAVLRSLADVLACATCVVPVGRKKYFPKLMKVKIRRLELNLCILFMGSVCTPPYSHPRATYIKMNHGKSLQQRKSCGTWEGVSCRDRFSSSSTQDIGYNLNAQLRRPIKYFL